MSNRSRADETGALAPADVAKLAWQAATLDERLSFGGRTGAPLPEPSVDELGAWIRAATPGDAAAFERRLAWDGISHEAVAHALWEAPPADLPDDWPAASWTAWLPRFLSGARRCAAEVGSPAWERELLAVSSPSEPVFVEAWIPLLRAAREQLAARAPRLDTILSRDALLALEADLVRQYGAVGGLALEEEFRKLEPVAGAATAPTGGYQRFVQALLGGAWSDVLTRHPALARQLARLTEDWIEGTAEMVERASRDAASIERTFGFAANGIVQVRPSLSDRHAGRTVAMVRFGSGLQLAYKPRDVRLEAAYNRFLDWLRAAGLAAPPALRVLDRGEYGWVEWATQATFGSRVEVEAYYRRAGALACVVYLLGGADLHGENVVASAGGPILVDPEMLLQPTAGSGPADAGDVGEAVGGASTESCLKPGLISLVRLDADRRAIDIGGLQPARPLKAAVARREWRGLRRDDLHSVAEDVLTPSLANDVRLNGVVQGPGDFAREIGEGFEETYRFITARRDELTARGGLVDRFTDCPTRVLFRPSNQYGALQYVLAAPRYQGRGIDRSLAIERLSRPFARETTAPRLWPLVGDERRALEALDIPRLALPASSRTLTAADGTRVDGYLERSGCETARARLSALDEDDLCRQLEELATALSPPRPGGQVVPGAVDGATLLLEAAGQVGLAVLARGRRTPGGVLAWPACRGRVDLYAGTGGVLLFLAALVAARPEDRWREAFEATLEGIRARVSSGPVEDLGGVGACSGRPSLAYALVLAGQLAGDASAIEAGLTAAGGVKDAIESDRVLDVEGGAAGALLALLAIREMTGQDDLLEPARLCVRRLLAAQIAEGSDRGAWPAGADARPRPGFAHGAAGIAYALARWLPCEPSADVSRAISRAWEYERAVWAGSGGTWPTIRSDGSRIVMAAWCHGAPGIALARACSSRHVRDDRLAGEIEAAVRATLAAPAAQRDHLCCGNLGRADALLTVGRIAGHPVPLARGTELARGVASQILAEGRHGMRGEGFDRGAPAPGFFQGLSGIGYQLLRFAQPRRLPSVLAFDAGDGRHA